MTIESEKTETSIPDSFKDSTSRYLLLLLQFEKALDVFSLQ
ncbi:hypothetical protein [Paenibacillus sp. IITD108]